MPKAADTSRHVWEGWTVNAFIEHLEVTFQYQKFHTRQELTEWCKSEQPYYKKLIPEVVEHFAKKSNL